MFEELAEKMGIELLIEFGATARGIANAKSDLDIAVVRRFSRERWSFDELCEIETGVYETLRPSREIDLVATSDADPLLLGEIARHGRVLYARNAASFPRFASLAMRIREDGEKWIIRRRRILRDRSHAA